jgi:hypothetical protein
VYEGEFQNDQREGSGTFTWSDGSIYTGTFVDDLIEGKGKCFWPASNNVYDGEWKQGKRSG